MHAKITIRLLASRTPNYKRIFQRTCQQANLCNVVMQFLFWLVWLYAWLTWAFDVLQLHCVFHGLLHHRCW